VAARPTAASATAPALAGDHHGSAVAASGASDTGGGDTGGGDTGGGDTGGGEDATGRAAVGRGASSAARLLRNAACADLFPYAARSDRGTVAVALDVALSGQPMDAQIVDEAPRGQGFALAARHCVRRLRFSPALDASGHAVASRSVVQLRFERRRETARASL
jgi:outer membrane biosynthesis protein TonB